MNTVQSSTLLFTMKTLRSEGSWCGETHIQKTIYIGQELFHIPVEFKFVLYKHGPYSFQLSEALQALISDELISIVTKPPYGPSLEVSVDASYLVMRFDQTSPVADRIRFLSQKLAKKNVADLERIATAVFINKNFGPDQAIQLKSKQLHSIKPHVSLESAEAAFKEVIGIADAYRTRFAANA